MNSIALVFKFPGERLRAGRSGCVLKVLPKVAERARIRKSCCWHCGKKGQQASDWETGGIDVVGIDLSALEIGAVHLLEGDHKTRIRIDSCVAVLVFPKTVADDYPLAKQRVTGQRLASCCWIEVKVKDGG